MKLKISISMEKATIRRVEEQLKNSAFRNKSHFIELATEKLLEEVKDVKKDN